MKAFCEKISRPEAVRFVLERAYRHAQKAAVEGEHEVVIRKANKSRDQEERYHAMIGDIARQFEHYGRKWHAEDMKRILVDAFKHETKGDTVNFPELQGAWEQMGDMRLVPAIGRDGFVPLGEQTRRFPKVLASAFITWLFAFGSDHRINWSDPQYAREMEMAA
jgi:hypothetical protein